MKLHWSQLGDKLVSAGGKAEHEVLLIAPFAKVGALSRVIAVVPESVPIRCVTRWRLEEIAAGVSDLNCYQLLAGRAGSSLFLCPNLHTKYFRFDSLAFLGSANLTQAALGWSQSSNAEALIEFKSEELEATEFFEGSILSNSVEVDGALYAEFMAMLSEYKFEPLPKDLIEAEEASPFFSLNNTLLWVPSCRSPEYLFKIYKGNNDAMSIDGTRAALVDLRYLDLPGNLSESSFYQTIQSRLLMLPILKALDKFVVHPRRFGEMRNWTREYLDVENATDSWQTIMRWLTYFLPHRYQVHTANYSEVFSRLVEK